MLMGVAMFQLLFAMFHLPSRFVLVVCVIFGLRWGLLPTQRRLLASLRVGQRVLRRVHMIRPSKRSQTL